MTVILRLKEGTQDINPRHDGIATIAEAPRMNRDFGAEIGMIVLTYYGGKEVVIDPYAVIDMQVIP